MKKILSILVLIFFSLQLHSQEEYISYSKYDADCFGDLDGKGGILLLSKRNDLVIGVTNAKNVTITPTGKRADDLYAYEVVVDRKETENVKLEVSRRGEVFMTDFVVKTKPDVFMAYLIENVERPIQEKDQTRPNDAILDEKLSEIEFVSAIEDLKIDCPKILSMGGKINIKNQLKEKGTIVTSLVIPIKIIQDAKNELQSLQKERDNLHRKLTNENTPESQKQESEWIKLDQLESQLEEKNRLYAELTHISVYAKGTNRLTVDISSLGPRSKMSYGILLLKTIQKVHVSQCAGFMDEGGRQFMLREYKNARQAFENALIAKDTPSNLIPSIKTSIAQCDTCAAYEKYTLAAFARMREIRTQGGSQEEAVKCATVAIEYLQKINQYNPNEFYTNRIKQLENMIKTLPLEIRFTTVRWVKSVGGISEAGKIPNVEIWSFKGNTPPVPKSYSSDKKFKDLTGKSNEFEQIGITDEEGQVDLKLDRQALPTGLFFRPTGVEGKIKIQYMDFKELFQKSEGTYNKRRFRLKMYVAY